MAFKFTEHDKIVAVFAESAHGPGWANQPLWVVVRSNLDGSFRRECIQPQDQTAEMLYLYRISEATHMAMKSAVQKFIDEKRHETRENRVPSKRSRRS